MNMFQLFTASGITQALHAHHKRLHENYGFAPLTGKKSIHKFAENFGFSNAEPFIAKLTSLYERTLNPSVNLSNSEMDALVHIEADFDLEVFMLRILVEDNDAFILHTIDQNKLAPAIIQYEQSDTAFVIIGAYVVKLALDNDSVHAQVFESKMPDDVDPKVISDITESSEFKLLEEDTHYFSESDFIEWSQDDEEEIMNSFTEAMDKACATRKRHVISASVISDDDNVNITFDAVEYFESELANGNIETVFEALEGCDFDADYPTDTIAEFFCDSSTQRLFSYLESMDEGGEIGYRCTIDKLDAFKWLQDKAQANLRQHQKKSASKTDSSQNKLSKDALDFIAEHSNLTEEKEFFFSSDKTGVVTPFGQVTYNHQGVYDYEFSTVHDFVSFAFYGDRDVPYRMSERLGELDENGNIVFDQPQLKNRPLREIDEDSVYGEFKAYNAKPAVLIVQKNQEQPVATAYYSANSALAALSASVVDDCITFAENNAEDALSALGYAPEDDDFELSEADLEKLVTSLVLKQNVEDMKHTLEMFYGRVSIQIVSAAM